MTKISFIVFGGTGDLTKRKLVTAFAQLVEDKIISEDSLFIGNGRSEYDDDSYKKMLIDFQNDERDKKRIKKLHIAYFKADVKDPTSFEGFQEYLKNKESGKVDGRIFYLATSFMLFDEITPILSRCKEKLSKDSFVRIVFEKPFGKNLKTHDEFERSVSKVFDQKQIFRIDHYLGKETISNLHTLKFENPLFESVLHKKYVESIEIIVDEDFDVAQRINYYNEFGAIKDMIQSHLLQVASLLIMERPKDFTPQNIHKKKLDALNSLKFDIKDHHILGQYAEYDAQRKKAKLDDNRIETFAKIILTSKLSRWKGVPLSLRTGKHLPSKYGQIRITLKHTTYQKCFPNVIEVNIQPDQDINLLLNVGRMEVCEQVKLNFCHSCRFGPNSINGYEKMFKDIINNDNIMFTTVEENRSAWKLIEKIESQKENMTFVYYNKNEDPEVIADGIK